MYKILIPFVMATAVLAGCATSSAPGNDPAAPLKRIQILQAKADEYAAGRSGAAAYAPQKALAWLDMAQDEYYEDDRTGIVAAATDEAERLLRQIEVGNAAQPFATPIPASAEKVRDDLWDKAAQLKQSPNFACAAKQLAQLDVQLVWTGHEYWESGWSHAKTHSEVADKLAYEAEMAIRHCADTGRSASASVEKISFATDALVGKILPAGLILSSGRGAAAPLLACANTHKMAARQACLQANRRVEISVAGIK